MKWVEEKSRLYNAGTKYTAKINNSLTLMLNVSELEKGKQTRTCYLSVCSGNVPIHNVSFGAFDVESAKDRSVVEARNFIEQGIERYRGMLDALERANAETE